MSDLPLYESPEDVPAPQPREAMRFERITVTPYADGRRVKLNFTFPPFQERPSVEAWVTDAQGRVVAAMSLIEAMEQDFEFTLHLRSPEPRGAHTLRLALFYLLDEHDLDRRQVVDERAVPFTIEPPY
ncbi:MAG: hypothetical protein JNK29_05435 [Anaerolineales bacterium]|nr:hypothetical protein [Anaerolineales bacterium]